MLEDVGLDDLLDLRVQLVPETGDLLADDDAR